MGGRVAILLAFLLISVGCAKETPLSEIWALQMPGTKNVQDLEPEHYGKSQQGLSSEDQLEHLSESLTYQILQTINEKPQDKPLGPGFVVTGSGRQALKNVKEALNTTPPNNLPANQDLSLFFYSRLFGSYVHVKRVTRSANKVYIEFAFVTHGTRDMSNHFALIPLGKLPPGKFDVQIIPSSEKGLSGQERTLKSITRDYVCQPFSFLVSSSDELEEKR